MISGRTRLLDAARELLTAHPELEPTTRDLYETAGVAAPTLYHHFGTKEGLLDVVVEQAFTEYLERKKGIMRSGDLVVDFAAGWDLHVAFGVDNPVLYALMYAPGRTSDAAATADELLRAGLQRMNDAGLLRIDVDTAVVMTTGMAVGCVSQLNRLRRPATDPTADAMRSALLAALTTVPSRQRGTETAATPPRAARLLIDEVAAQDAQFTAAESALFIQWLHRIADTTPTAQEAQSE
ncbi:TetR/AcrR family transcriptional regulator [Curtobacterium ammoniigenes]|uniref:TetR/AcrR family transcriptional regulator n=1 Tax=Curtobacterium ammoniigenes TaxID=395387 RepID=UPI00082BCC07|nr:TetR/AcrR family transcriptional regulator [Curtobacterium ammoniigenes]